MKNLINSILSLGSLLLFPTLIFGQTPTTSENYVLSTTYKKPVKTNAEILDLKEEDKTTAIQYFDGLGRLKQSVVLRAGGEVFTRNELPIDWETGTPGSSATFFNSIGSNSESQILDGVTPFGDTDLMWECSSSDQGNDSAGGWNTDTIEIDNTTSYRYTVWVKKNKTGIATQGRTYHGIKHVDNLNGTPSSNPYFLNMILPEADKWYLMVGVIHPHDYNDENSQVTGLYEMDGTKIFGGLEFKWRSNETSTYLRNYLYYATDTTVKQYLWSPLFQKLDGTELPLDDVLTQNEPLTIAPIVKDIVTHVAYDEFGRQKKEYLPYASTSNNGAYRPGDIALETQAYYQTKYAEDFAGVSLPDVNAYSEKEFENSPLNRVLKQAAPGEDWKLNDLEDEDGHEIEFNYQTNTASEVTLFEVAITETGNQFTPSLVGGSSYYDPNELYKTITKDENHDGSDSKLHTTEEFKNKQGQVILKRTYALVSGTETAHDTYYVYDAYGNLTYVLPPKSNATNATITQAILDNLGYQYKYDYRNRLIEKKIPGKGWECIVYDMLDRPVMTQDAIQKTNKKWLYTKYDQLGRVVTSGIYTHVSDIDQPTMQAHFNTQNEQSSANAANRMFESKQTNASNHYYTNNNFPSIGIETLTVNYYDNYTLALPTGLGTTLTTSYGDASTTRTKSLATASKVKVLETTPEKWITTVTYYDDKARPVYVHSQNDYLETTDIVESKLDFIGKVLEAKASHAKGANTPIVTIDRFDYDHQDRLVEQTQKIDSQIPTRVVRNNYDEIGQLKSKLIDNGTQKGYDMTHGAGHIVIDNDLVTKNSGPCWYAGFSTQGGFNENGYVEFTPTQIDKYFMVGLSNSDLNPYISIDYAIYIRDGGKVYINESGKSYGLKGFYQIGDIFRVERIGHKIQYKKNGETFYISTKTSTGRLIGDVSICHNGLSIKDLHIVDNSQGLQDVDYKYNVRGWLKNINEDNYDDNDLFNFGITYNDPTDVSKALFNGNISQTNWNTLLNNTSSNPVSSGYTYDYDALNRITGAVDNTGNYNLQNVTYDKMGNILTLQRKGHTNVGATSFGTMDNLAYTYDTGNKLLKVVDTGNKTYGFKDGANTGNDYTYDINGNLTKDANKEVTSISYNHLNMPTEIKLNNSNNKKVNYVYDAYGTKLRKVKSENGTITTTDYAGNYVYENNVLQFFSHPEGYTTPNNSNGFDYVYQYKDHLGNVRLSYQDTDNNGVINPATEILEEKNYYPFGMLQKGYNNVVSPNGNSVANKKGYNNKELQDELGLNWLDYGARNYDASLGRFFGVDKFAEKFEHMSPYQYANNTPTYFIDKNGEYISIYLTIGTGKNKRRQELRYNNKDNKFYYHGGKSAGKAYAGKNSFVGSVTKALGDIESGGAVGKALVGFLADNKSKGVRIRNTKNGNAAGTKGDYINFNPNSKSGGLDTKGNTSRPTFIGLAHEMAHVKDAWNGTQDNTFWFSYKNSKGKTRSKTFKEVYASFVENQIRGENNLSLRDYYSPTASSKTRITTQTVNKMLKNLAAKIITVQPIKVQAQQINLQTFKSKN